MAASFLRDFLSSSEWLQMKSALEEAIERALAHPKNHTPDLGGGATTQELGNAVRDGVS